MRFFRYSFPVSNFFRRLVAVPLIAALLFGVWVSLVAPTAARGQAAASPTASPTDSAAGLRGVVSDPHQAVVTGALVKAINLQTKKVYSARTDTQGNFEIKGLPAGEYKIEVTARGFTVAQAGSVKVEVAEAVTRNLSLTVAKSSHTVEVNALALENDVKTLTPPALLTLPQGIKGDSIVFTAEDIEALHPATLLDVLQQVPGMEVTFQGRQHMDFVSMRGGNFQIILDGVYMSQADRLLATLPVQSVESMTIVRDSTALSIGPLSAYHAFGSGSTGVGNQGFVVIKTKRSATADLGFVTSGGNYGSALGHGYAGNKSGNWDYRAAYTYNSTEGRSNWNMAAHNASAMFHGGYTSGKNNMDFSYFGNRGNRNMEYGYVEMPAGSTCQYGSGPNYGKNYLAPYQTLCQSTFNLSKMDGDLFALNASHLWNDNNRTVLQYGFDRQDIIGGAGSKQPSTEGSFDLKHTIRIWRQSITGGTQVMRYIAPLGSAPSATALTSRLDDLLASWYVQDEVPLWRDRLVLDGGLRGDKLHNGYSTAAKKSVDIWTPQFMTVALGLTFKAAKALTFTTRYGMVQAAPPSNVVTASTTALPNQTQNRGEVGMQTKVKSWVNPHASVYFYNTKNATASSATCTNPYTGQKNQSTWNTPAGDEVDCVALAGTIKTAGAEVGFSGNVIKRLTYDVGYGFVATNNNSANNNMSHNFVNARLGYRQRGWFGNFSMVYVGPKRASTSPLGVIYYQLGDYNRLDANVGRDIKLFDRELSVSWFGRNLTSNLYATRYVTGAYRDPGLQYGVQIAVRLLPAETKKK